MKRHIDMYQHPTQTTNNKMAILRSLEEIDVVWDQMATKWAQRAERLEQRKLGREQRRAKRAMWQNTSPRM